MYVFVYKGFGLTSTPTAPPLQGPVAFVLPRAKARVRVGRWAIALNPTCILIQIYIHIGLGLTPLLPVVYTGPVTFVLPEGFGPEIRLSVPTARIRNTGGGDDAGGGTAGGVDTGGGEPALPEPRWEGIDAFRGVEASVLMLGFELRKEAEIRKVEADKQVDIYRFCFFYISIHLV